MAQEKYLGENGLKRLVGLVKEDLGTKANIDGSYDGMQVGSAKQIVSPTGITDTTPYVFRTTCGETSISGGDEQLASLKAIRGNTIVWNQLINVSSKANTTLNGITFTNNHDGSYTLNGTATAQTIFTLNQPGVFTKGHKYLVKGCPSGGSTSTYNLYIDFFKNDTGDGFIHTLNADLTGLNIKLVVENGTTVNNIVFRPQMFDLTQIFGPGNEPTSVLEFTRLFPKPYYPFNAGEIRNAKTTGLKTTGYNQLSLDRTVGTLNGVPLSNGNAQDFEENKYYAGLASNDYVCQESVTNVSISGNTISFTSNSGAYGLGLPIRVIAGQTYTLEMTGTNAGPCYVAWYGQNGLFISSVVADNNVSTTVPDNAYWGVVILRANADGATATYSNICFHLTWSGSRTGYALHEEHVLDIDTSRYFPDGMNGIDGVYDELTPKAASKRIGTYTFTGNETFVDYIGGGWSLSIVLNDIKKPSSSNDKAIVKWALGITLPVNSLSSSPEYTIGVNELGRFYIVTAKTPSELVSALIGKKIYFALAEPVITEIPQVRDNHWEIKVDDYGTEEWLFNEGDEIPVPVGHETLYMDNLVDKLRNLPEPSEYQEVVDKVNAPKLLSDIVDADGNKRFQYVPLELGAWFTKCNVQNGFAFYSINGHSFRIVAGGVIPSGTTLPTSGKNFINEFKIPKWLADKIFFMDGSQWGDTKNIVPNIVPKATRKSNIGEVYTTQIDIGGYLSLKGRYRSGTNDYLITSSIGGISLTTAFDSYFRFEWNLIIN